MTTVVDDGIEIPGAVLEVIEQEQARLDAEAKEKDDKEKAERLSAIAKGRELFEASMAELLPKIWPPLVPFLLVQPNENAFMHAGRRGELEVDVIRFNVPGLAPLFLRVEQGTWQCASPGLKIEDSFDPEIEWRDWHNALTKPALLEATLVRARSNYLQYEQMTIERENRLIEKALQAADREQRKLVGEEKESVEQENVTAVDEALWDAIKNDPVAVLLIKAFLVVKITRDSFEERIVNADEQLYTMEEHWSRRAASLRKDAEDADRRAEDERNRISGLEAELDDAERELKKAKRGW